VGEVGGGVGFVLGMRSCFLCILGVFRLWDCVVGTARYSPIEVEESLERHAGGCSLMEGGSVRLTNTNIFTRPSLQT